METEIDYFQVPNLLPKEVQEVLFKWCDEELDYTTIKLFLSEVEEVGYTFDYYLDAQPYNLHKKQ